MPLDADASAQITTTRSARLRMLHTDNGHTIFVVVVVVADCVFSLLAYFHISSFYRDRNRMLLVWS